MARRKKRKQSNPSITELVGSETLRAIWGIFLIAFAIFLVLSAFKFGGAFGTLVYEWLSLLLGVGYALLPLSVLLFAVVLFRALEEHIGILKFASAGIFFIATLALVQITLPGKGGVVGEAIAGPLVAAFDVAAAVIFLGAFIIASLLIALDVNPALVFANIRERLERAKEDEEDMVGVMDDPTIEEADIGDEEEYGDEEEEEDDEEEDVAEKTHTWSAQATESEDGIPIMAISGGDYTPPPLSLLGKNKGKPEVGDVKANANIIKRTLQNFGIQVEMDEVSIGPTVTRYAMKPAEGVRLAKIVALQSNLELALAASPVRIEAPIPGKSLVGIEVPNTSRTTLGLAPLFADSAFSQSEKPLLLSLGRNITGAAHFADLARMPHMLIAGATGAGKSVTIHNLVVSLLYRRGPDQLRFVMVDPKRVELTLYNSIPHLLTPVITDAKKAILALKWLAKEMDRRYDVLEAEKVRDIASYHANVFDPAMERGAKEGEELPEPMPYIVLIIDELADIMQTYPRELEAGIVRLAQMSRAVGIHLILSTQRPSVKVITGLIKANIPARLALQVASQIDSRTILDMGGAEKLLGAGDMLFLSGEMSKPKRLQAPYITEDEVKKVVKHIIKNSEGFLPHEIDLSGGGGSSASDAIFAGGAADEDDDELYEEARQIVIEAGKASTSYLQRKLRVGYARAARLMDLLEERGVIGPADGSKPREVLDGSDGYDEEDADDTDYDEDER